jgi:hypothetical protein
MPDTTAHATKRPVFFAIAIALGLAILPLFAVHDRYFLRQGGDGLQGFWEGMLIFAGCASASAVCIVIGWKRDERPRWLTLLALASLLVPVFVLMI